MTKKRSIFYAGVIALSVTTPPAMAQTPSATSAAELHHFKVAAGPLREVIAEISSQARASVSVEDAADLEVPANGVSGDYTLADAITHALAGTPLKLAVGVNGAFLISRRDDETNVIVVRGRRTDFALNSSSLLTRTDTPLRQTPGTIDSVTEEVLDSQNALTISDALRNIPGALYTAGVGAAPMIEGIQSGGQTFTNGLRNGGLITDPPTTDVASIEVLKGPASILTGTEVEGGVINFVPKRADGRRLVDVDLGFGSGTEVIAGLDWGGAISAEDGIYYRLVLLADRADELPGGGGLGPHQYVINPIFGYRGGSTRFDTSIQFFDKRTPLRPAAAFDPDTGEFLSYAHIENRESATELKSGRMVYSLEQDLVSSGNLTLTVRNRGLLQRATGNLRMIAPLLYDVFGLGSFVSAFAYDQHETQVSEYLDLYGKFSTGALKHQLIFAFDFANRMQHNATQVSPGITNTILPLPPLPTTRNDADDEQYGLVLQDQMTLGRLHALVALRYSSARSRLVAVDPITQVKATAATVVKTDKPLPSLGLVYDVTPLLSIYASYSGAFKPARALETTFDGNILPPVIRKRYEIGLKWGALSDKLSINVSAYRLRTSNSALADPLHPNFYIPGPGLRAKGFEISAAGSLTPSLKMLAGYTYTDQKLADGTPGLGVPGHVANLWLIQTFDLPNDSKLTIGAGGNYNSGFTANHATFSPVMRFVEIDRPYVSANLSVGYTTGGVTINATMNNVFDRVNYAPAVATGQLIRDIPRTFRIILRREF